VSEPPVGPGPKNARDPLPRIFIVCALISLVLMVVILGAIFLDMASRSDRAPIQPMVPTNPAPAAQPIE